MRASRGDRFVALWIMAVLASACSSSSSQPRDTPQVEAPKIVVTRNNTSWPLQCQPLAVAQTIVEFFAALERGDGEQLDGLFSPEPSFQWYSVGEAGRNIAITDRDRLLPYFLRRHAQHERLRLLMVSVLFDRPMDVAHIAYVITRHADDLRPGLGGRKRLAEGKGDVDCRNNRIAVWSMGMDMAPVKGVAEVARRYCPRPSNWHPDLVAVACAKHS